MKRNQPNLLYTIAWALALLWITGCQTANAPANATATEETTAEFKTLAPQRVDIRGVITTNRYDQGQVMIEVEGTLAAGSRYNRAYVLVLPTVQIIDPDGRTLSMNELRSGQDVAILLRGGGRGNMAGVGIARKIWLEVRQ